MTASVTVPGRVEWMDTDAAGIYHNSALLRFVEGAEAELMRGLGIHGYFPVAPRVRFSVDFESPLLFEQPVTTSLRVARVGTRSLELAFEVWGEQFDGRPRRRAAYGSYVTAHLRSEPWPADWVRRLG